MAEAASGGNAGPTTTPEERARAAEVRENTGTAAAAGPGEAAAKAFVDTLPNVQIDVGIFKYVLIQAVGTQGTRHMVRGVLGASYHVDAATPTLNLLQQHDCLHRVLGGGRIRHDDEAKEISIYGHSYGFPWEGKSMHDVTQKLCQEAYPGYANISWSDEGY